MAVLQSRFAETNTLAEMQAELLGQTDWEEPTKREYYRLIAGYDSAEPPTTLIDFAGSDSAKRCGRLRRQESDLSANCPEYYAVDVGSHLVRIDSRPLDSAAHTNFQHARHHYWPVD